MRPALRLLLFAAAAAAASVWPVLFAGKSFVSPNFGTRLLYQDFPTVPGSTDARTVPLYGSDVGAALWQDVPYSAIEARALLHDHALPRWNRYDSCGAPLLAQGQSMFGDPLQLLPILAGGRAWAWDAKFVLAKVLFAFGIGLLVWELTGDLTAAGLCAVAAPFIGFFTYRINHPAFFSLCYSPWILVAALMWKRRPTASDGGGEAAGPPLPLLLWFIADWALLCSGTVKEAYGLLAIFNLAGLILVLTASARRAALAAGMLAVFALVSLPLWRPVLALLRTSYITAAGPHATLLPPSLTLGLFDEAFFRPFTEDEAVFGPALNFLFLAGCLYAAACWRTLWLDRTARALGLITAAVALLDFGLIPPRWIAALPLVGSVGNVDNVLGCALVVLFSALAGVGFATARRRLPTWEGPWDLAAAGLQLLILTVLYLAFLNVIPRTTHYDGSFGLIHAGGPVAVSPYLVRYYVALLVTLPLAGFFAFMLSRPPGPRKLAILGLVLIAGLELWQGLPRREAGHPSALSAFRVAFPARARFAVPSPAVETVLRRAAALPGRTVGLGVNLFPGWSGYYGLEDISGPDAIMNPDYRRLTDAMAVDRRMDWMICVDPSSLPRQRRHLDFLNVRYYLDRAHSTGPHAGLKLAASSDLDLYESPTAWPRAFFVSSVTRAETAEELVRRLDDGDGAPFAALPAAAFAQEPALASLVGGSAAPRPATGYRLEENSTAFTVEAPGRGLAVLMEADWPGYPHAELDGHPAPTVRTNCAFIGVYVPAAGAHRIVVRYFF